MALEALYGILHIRTSLRGEENDKNIQIAERNVDLFRKLLRSLVTCVQSLLPRVRS
jgi:hypothetical protein